MVYLPPCTVQQQHTESQPNEKMEAPQPQTVPHQRLSAQEHKKRVDELNREFDKTLQNTKLLMKNHIDRLLEGRNGDDLAKRTDKLAELSKRFVEQSRKTRQKNRQRKLILLGIVVALVVGIGWPYLWWR